MKINFKALGCYAILFTFCAMSLSVNAQLHEKLQREGNLTFKQIVNQSEQHFDRTGRGKGVGYKQFQRWQYWASRNLDTSGKVRNTRDALQAYAKFSEQNSSLERAFDIDYVELGPLTSQYTSTWSSGLGRVSAIGLDPNNDNHIIVGSPTGGIWKTTNLGGSWTPLFDDQANIDVYALEISHANPNHYLGGLNGGMVRSTDGGANWSAVTGVDNSDLYNTIRTHPTDANIVFAVGQYRGKVFKSTNGGASFSLQIDITNDFFDLEFHPTNPNIIYVSGEDRIYKSTDGGTNFTQITTGPWNGSGNVIMIAVTPDAPNNLYALEEQGGGFNALYLSQDAGATWSTQDSYDGTNNIMGYDQTVQSGQAPRDMDIIVSPVDANIVHVAGVETWKSTNLGQSWVQTTRWNAPGASDFIHADIDLLIYDGNRIVAGTDGGIYYSTDDATSWTDISAGLAIRQFYRIGASQTDADRVSGGSQDNGTGTLVNGVWRDWLGADGMETFIDYSNADIIYATTQRGSLQKSTDGGISRASISQPSADNGNWVTPFEQDPNVASTIYTAKDQIYKSTNSGTSWSPISNFPSGLVDEMKISPANSNYIYASIGTTFYTTTDGGSSWSSTSIPAGSRINYITVHPTNASRVAIAISGSSSKIFESTNAGSNWTNITGNIPSAVTIECVLYDKASDGGFYAGGNPGVYYSASAGNANYSDVSRNLPRVRVTELEIRNDVLYVGTYGRGLWKYEFQCSPNEVGQPCDDFDECTENDVYDENCGCAGTPVGDSDNDGVCDLVDQCAGFDDTIDFDMDGIPDSCDTSIDCSSCISSISTFPHVEDFENGLGDICQFSSDDIDWTVLSGPTPSTGVGPSIAHSGSNYFYIESSDPNYPTKVAIFKGACYDTAGASSVSINFWYHMFGLNVNEIKLDVSSDGGSTYSTVWSASGNQGDQWLNANVDLSTYASGQLTYAFTATTGSDWQSDIAVDLITVDAVSGACSNNGGDADGDGICADLDCDDSDPNIGGEGSSCDDGDDCTENDVFDADCNCAGTVITADSDNDGVLDCVDQEINSPCPQDVDANGVSNDDDNDGIPNCNDSCDDRIDTDNDGTPDCLDNCPNDGNKTEPGNCGCGIADVDTDNDGVLDCNDQELNSPCPLDVDANGVSNDDDNDGIPNCNDDCDNNLDTDGDGILDCVDQEINSPCPQDIDANGVSNDDDNDGIPNCNDSCDNSIDTDGDGVADCLDNCPSDPNKTEPGDCGCGVSDVDTDGDGVLDCDDQEINSPCPQDVDANGISNDLDGDGVCDADDICPAGDDNIDSDGDGIPDACDSNCIPTTSSFSVGQLTHSGSGSGTTTLSLTGGTHTDASFSITEINSRLGGKPANRFDERVVVTYVDGNGSTQTYGTYVGSSTSSVNVSIAGEVQSISIALSDAFDGNSSTTMRITLGSVSSCVALNCTDSDGDGVCDADDICDGFDDNLIGTSCDDGDACTENDVYTTDCNCAGTYVDSDGDGVCDADDICPAGDDTIDLDGNGIPDACDSGDCTSETGNFSSGTLLHSGNGSSTTSFNFSALSTDVSFTVSGLGSKINGNKSSRYIDNVSISYIDANGNTQSYGNFSGTNQSTINVSISQDISSVTVTLSDGFDGNSPSISVNLSSIDYCTQSTGEASPSDYAKEYAILEDASNDIKDMRLFPNPANNVINVRFSAKANTNYNVMVKSILGRGIHNQLVKGSGQVEALSIDSSNWPTGIYFVVVSASNETSLRKVIIQR
ncbi:T9SS type A sorting domain-containing protein [Winogradskyella maritima]|uniref:T9SS type A sorting domain-containing protein n=1 Tax=Winogradskyella maritima TaxID=1517766 RepID=A0ABV8AFF0_9FLAO|nr:T9SS type A sorting domain-containing protein [Winogradskyella maritima]